MKICLTQLWIGEIPNYFWHHYETTKNLDYIDFLFITDQDIILDSKNYKIIKTTKEEIEYKLSSILLCDFKIKNNKKTCDLKASLSDIYSEHLIEYDYVGWYDIDTLFGDIKKYINEYLGDYDFISVGDDIFHNRISGIFTLMKNNDTLRKLYQKSNFIEVFENENVLCFEEHQLNELANQNFKVKVINSNNINQNDGGKIQFDCIWSGNKCYTSDKELMIFHFYYKNDTRILKIGNIISTFYNKNFSDDFLWVVPFTKNYEKFVLYLLDSISKYSNRKCVCYTINYNSDLQFLKQLNSEQFIFRRINIPEGKKDFNGRDNAIMNCKPLISLDAITCFPEKKFVQIDSDIYLTTNSDSILKYFDDTCHYPLINSHIHDTVWLSNIVPNEEWSSPIHILLKNMGLDVEPIPPRRKTNVILFDKKSKWFFEEQIELYNKFKDSNIPGILTLHDEDTANALLTKYNLGKCLPLIDIEDSHIIDFDKFSNLNHPFHWTPISPFVQLPKTKNDVLFFHGFKTLDDYNKITELYGPSVLECDDFLLKYENNTIFFIKNNYQNNKKLNDYVDFVVKNQYNDVILKLENQNIKWYSIFYINQIELYPGEYRIEIIEKDTTNKIYNNLIKI